MTEPGGSGHADRSHSLRFSSRLSAGRRAPHEETLCRPRAGWPRRRRHILLAHEKDGVVREYDTTGKVIWEFDVPLEKLAKSGHGPEAFGDYVYSAVRLENGNTLVGTGNGHSVLEVTPEKRGRLDVQGFQDVRQLAARGGRTRPLSGVMTAADAFG